MEKKVIESRRRIVKKVILREKLLETKDKVVNVNQSHQIGSAMINTSEQYEKLVEISLLPIKVIHENIDNNIKFQILEAPVKDPLTIDKSMSPTISVLPIILPINPGARKDICFHAEMLDSDLNRIAEEVRIKLGEPIKVFKLDLPISTYVRNISLFRLHNNIDIDYDLKQLLFLNVKKKDKTLEKIMSKEDEDNEYFIILDDLWMELFPGDLVSLFNKMVDGRPRVVLAYRPKNEYYDYILFLSTVLRDLYRIVCGGKPSMYYISRRSELEDYSILIKASGSITIIDVDELVNNDKCELSYIVKVLRNRIRELVSQELGFLVIYSTEKYMRHIVEELGKVLGTGNMDVVCVRINEEKTLKDFWRFISAYYGMVNVPKRASPSVYARNAESKYYRYLEEIQKDYDVLLKLQRSMRSNDRESESIEHLLYKAIVLKYLKNELNGDLSQIECEVKLNDIVADIYDKVENRIIEIETLFATEIPELKIRNTIMTRKDKSNELWIIMPNNSLLLWGTRIARFISMISRHENLKGKIKLYGINIKDKSKPELIEFKKLIKNITQIYQR